MATIGVEGRRAEVQDGKRLVLAIEEDLGIDILHRCGGNAMCTTCRVEFELGEPSRMTEAERERLTDRDLLDRARLSCQSNRWRRPTWRRSSRRRRPAGG